MKKIQAELNKIAIILKLGDKVKDVKNIDDELKRIDFFAKDLLLHGERIKELSDTARNVLDRGDFQIGSGRWIGSEIEDAKKTIQSMEKLFKKLEKRK